MEEHRVRGAVEPVDGPRERGDSASVDLHDGRGADRSTVDISSQAQSCAMDHGWMDAQEPVGDMGD